MGLQSSHRRGHGVARARPRRVAPRADTRTTRTRQAAEHQVELAAARYRALRAAAAAGPPRKSLRSWQLLVLLVLGGGAGLGVLLLWLLATMYLGYVALIVLPVVIGLAALVVVRNREEHAVRRPCVEDLVRAMRELREAEAAVRRAQVREGAALPAGHAARSADSAELQATTWSSTALSASAWCGSGANREKFSKSLCSESAT
jgi:hypothetical protein